MGRSRVLTGSETGVGSVEQANGNFRGNTQIVRCVRIVRILGQNGRSGAIRTDNGPRFVQTRQWTVDSTTVEPSPPAAEITLSSLTAQPVGSDEVVFVETNHLTDRMLDVAWRLDGKPIPNPHNSRNLDLGALELRSGTYELTATVTDPADPGGVSDTVEWSVDNVLPKAHRTQSEPLTTLDGDLEHPVYPRGAGSMARAGADRQHAGLRQRALQPGGR